MNLYKFHDNPETLFEFDNKHEFEPDQLMNRLQSGDDLNETQQAIIKSAITMSMNNM